MRHALMATIVAAAAAPSFADYMTPEQAGFRDCMLIYESPTRGVDDLMPFVAHLRDGSTPDAWLFDSFLFLRYSAAPSGASYYDGPTVKSDWEASLDTWFEPGRDLPALQEAVDRTERTLGKPPRPIQVVISIHYPHTSQADFGDVDGDGKSEDLADPTDRLDAVRWYTDTVMQRFAEAHFENLELWGFYWMNEGIVGGDSDIVRATADLLHERGLRFLWIPYFRAPGFDQCGKLGFDVAILQPNYAFITQHNGLVRNDRLIETADLARQYGLGIEIEVGYSPEVNLRERGIFRDYLAFGALELCDYQRAVKAYFQSIKVFPNLMGAADPDARAVYDEIAEFIRGEPIPRPGGLQGGRVTIEGRADADASRLVDGRFSEDAAIELAGPESALIVDLPQVMPLAEFEVSCSTREDGGWSGVASVETKSTMDAPWRPAGWVRTTVATRLPGGARSHVIAIPTAVREAAAVRVHLRSDDPSARLSVDELSAVDGGPLDPPGGTSLALGMPYKVEPDVPRTYPDDGRLTDGAISTEGFSQGRSVGWYGRDVIVCLDLSREQMIDRVVVLCDGGGHGAVHFPETVITELSPTAPVGFRLNRGYGAPPPGPAAAILTESDQVVIDREQPTGNGQTNAQGHYDIRPPQPTPARFVTLRFSSLAWLMLSEIEVWSGGANVALGASYEASPRPSLLEPARYADDGGLLTDGCVPAGFEASGVVGWTGGARPSITVDLLVARPVSEVTVHTLGGGLYGIVAPPSAVLELSEDGQVFRQVAEGALTDPGDNACRALELILTPATTEQARFLRITLQPSPGWTMVSEVTAN